MEDRDDLNVSRLLNAEVEKSEEPCRRRRKSVGLPVAEDENAATHEDIVHRKEGQRRAVQGTKRHRHLGRGSPEDSDQCQFPSGSSDEESLESIMNTRGSANRGRRRVAAKSAGRRPHIHNSTTRMGIGGRRRRSTGEISDDGTLLAGKNNRRGRNRRRSGGVVRSACKPSAVAREGSRFVKDTESLKLNVASHKDVFPNVKVEGRENQNGEYTTDSVDEHPTKALADHLAVEATKRDAPVTPLEIGCHLHDSTVEPVVGRVLTSAAVRWMREQVTKKLGESGKGIFAADREHEGEMCAFTEDIASTTVPASDSKSSEADGGQGGEGVGLVSSNAEGPKVHLSPLDMLSAQEIAQHLRTLKIEALARPLHSILAKYMYHPLNRGVFNEPVDPEAMQLKDYRLIIKKPMDLGTIKQRLLCLKYDSARQFEADVRLVFNNACRYNPAGHDIHDAAKKLLKEFGKDMDRTMARHATMTKRQNQHYCELCQGHTCGLCGEKCLKFEPSSLYCAGRCGQKVKRGAHYYSTPDRKAVWCQKCYQSMGKRVRIKSGTNLALLMRQGSESHQDYDFYDAEDVGDESSVGCGTSDEMITDDYSIGGVGAREAEATSRPAEALPDVGADVSVGASGVGDGIGRPRQSANPDRMSLRSRDRLAVKPVHHAGACEERSSSPKHMAASPAGRRTTGQEHGDATQVDVLRQHTAATGANVSEEKGEEGFLLKQDLIKRKFDDQITEPWVQCDQCDSWMHQVCCLFNERENNFAAAGAPNDKDSSPSASDAALTQKTDGEGVEPTELPYLCPHCQLRSVTQADSPQQSSSVISAEQLSFSSARTSSFPYSAAALKETELSKHMERQVQKRLWQLKLQKEAFDRKIDSPTEPVEQSSGRDPTPTSSSSSSSFKKFEGFSGGGARAGSGASSRGADADTSTVETIDPSSIVIRVVSNTRKTAVVPESVRSTFYLSPGEGLADEQHNLGLSASASTADERNKSRSPRGKSSSLAMNAKRKSPGSKHRRNGSKQKKCRVAEEDNGGGRSASKSSPSGSSTAPSSKNTSSVAQVHGTQTAQSFYPSSITYTAKTILLFQKIEGLDVCLLALFVQEFGEDAPPPNTNRVYISYLDSVGYFRPRCVRSEVYHEVIVSYLAFCRRRGFETAHIWSCPPARGNDFIFWCHPPHQRNPGKDRLVQWYRKMIQRAIQVGAATRGLNMFEYYFKERAKNANKANNSSALSSSSLSSPAGSSPKERKNASSTSSSFSERRSQSDGKVEGKKSDAGQMVLLPYFEGDYWVLEADRLLSLPRVKRKSDGAVGGVFHGSAVVDDKTVNTQKLGQGLGSEQSTEMTRGVRPAEEIASHVTALEAETEAQRHFRLQRSLVSSIKKNSEYLLVVELQEYCRECGNIIPMPSEEDEDDDLSLLWKLSTAGRRAISPTTAKATTSTSIGDRQGLLPLNPAARTQEHELFAENSKLGKLVSSYLEWVRRSSSCSSAAAPVGAIAPSRPCSTQEPAPGGAFRSPLPSPTAARSTRSSPRSIATFSRAEEAFGAFGLALSWAREDVGAHEDDEEDEMAQRRKGLCSKCVLKTYSNLSLLREMKKEQLKREYRQRMYESFNIEIANVGLRRGSGAKAVCKKKAPLNTGTEQETGKDEFMSCPLLDTRDKFLYTCEFRHYQWDTLRRAKHSTMMLLHHVHRPQSLPCASLKPCHLCGELSKVGQQLWSCRVCIDFWVCEACKKDENHLHHLTPELVGGGEAGQDERSASESLPCATVAEATPIVSVQRHTLGERDAGEVSVARSRPRETVV